jgi:hypothetical protein|nr:MAG TPA: hypothetical protein [Caudoviricetes sp.]
MARVSTSRKETNMRKHIYSRDQFKDGGVYKWDEDEGMWYELKTDFGYWNHILYTDPGEACDLGTAIEIDYFENLPVEMLDPVLRLIRDYQVDEDGNESDQEHWFARWEESE